MILEVIVCVPVLDFYKTQIPGKDVFGGGAVSYFIEIINIKRGGAVDCSSR